MVANRRGSLRSVIGEVKMRRSNWKCAPWVFLGLWISLACSSSSGSEPAGGSAKGESCAKTADCAANLKCISQECVPDLPQGFCQQYADLCPGDAVDVYDCEDTCFDSTAASIDDCWFKACGVIAGKCDNEDPNDEAISACAAQRGWK